VEVEAARRLAEEEEARILVEEEEEASRLAEDLLASEQTEALPNESSDKGILQAIAHGVVNTVQDVIVEDSSIQAVVMKSLPSLIESETSTLSFDELTLAQVEAEAPSAPQKVEVAAALESVEKLQETEEDNFEKQMELATQFRSTFAQVAGKGIDEESHVIEDESNYQVKVNASKFTDTRTINAILVQPNPWIVIKTKQVSGGKVFINLCHHPWLPNLPSISQDMLNSSIYQEYLQINFIQFTLSKVRNVMHVGVLQENLTEKEGGESGKSQIVDVSVHSQVYLTANRDPELADKMFVKVIKAVGRQFDFDLDVDYKLPRTLRNYKGQEVAILKVDAYPPMRMKSVEVTAVTDFDAAGFRPSQLPEVSSLNSPATPAVAVAAPTAQYISPMTTVNDESSISTEASLSSSASPRAQPAHRSASMSAAMMPTTAATESMGVSPTRAKAQQRASFASVNHEWNVKWSRVLRPGVNVVYTSPIIKRNRMNLAVKRQLILTDEPSLFYVDASTYAIKGDIEWSVSNPPNAVKVKDNIFDIVTAGRTFRMEDQDKNAERWANMINSLAQYVKNSRK
jgi:hypothetical protein